MAVVFNNAFVTSIANTTSAPTASTCAKSDPVGIPMPKVSRTAGELAAYLDKYVYGVADRAGYLALFDRSRLAKLGLAEKEA